MSTENTLLVSLLGRCADGEQPALARFYALTSTRVFAYILDQAVPDQAVSQQTAEDALVQTYTQVWRHIQDFSPSGSTPLEWTELLARKALGFCAAP